jgi:hypothetical protein
MCSLPHINTSYSLPIRILQSSDIITDLKVSHLMLVLVAHLSITTWTAWAITREMST